MESSGQSVYISHHAVKCHRAVPLDEHDCVHMGIIHVQKRVGRELHRLVFTTTPLMKGCIELIGYISTAQQKKRPHLLSPQLYKKHDELDSVPGNQVTVRCCGNLRPKGKRKVEL